MEAFWSASHTGDQFPALSASLAGEFLHKMLLIDLNCHGSDTPERRASPSATEVNVYKTSSATASNAMLTYPLTELARP